MRDRITASGEEDYGIDTPEVQEATKNKSERWTSGKAGMGVSGVGPAPSE